MIFTGISVVCSIGWIVVLVSSFPNTRGVFSPEVEKEIKEKRTEEGYSGEI